MDGVAEARLEKIDGIHERLRGYVDPLAVQLDVLRLLAHSASAGAGGAGAEAAREYDSARRHLDRFQRSLSRARSGRLRAHASRAPRR